MSHISVSDIKSIYNNAYFHMTWQSIKTAYEGIDALGAIPEYPEESDHDSDYNSITTSRNTWISSKNAYNNSIAAALAFLNEKGGDSDELKEYLPPNTWVKLKGLSNWGIYSTQWIGIKSSSEVSNADNIIGMYLPNLITSLVNPTKPFPNV